MNIKKFMTTLSVKKLIFCFIGANKKKQQSQHTITSDIQLTNDELLRSVTYS